MWEVETTDVFDKWLVTQSEPLIEDVLAIASILEETGPHPGRPFVDTVNGSTFPNMKALRVQHAGSPVRIFSLLTLFVALFFYALTIKKG